LAKGLCRSRTVHEPVRMLKAPILVGIHADAQGLPQLTKNSP